jgi:hypothetical protein
MKTTRLLLIAALLPCFAFSALSADTGALKVKNKSGFNATPGMHNPFWPIGWVKQGPLPAPVAAKAGQGISSGGFSVSSIMLGNPTIAVINGRGYEEGENLRINGVKTDVQIVAIRDGEVILRSGESQIAIQMKRR